MTPINELQGLVFKFTYRLSMNSELRIPALGSTCCLGRFYNAKTGQFLNESVFNVEDITKIGDHSMITEFEAISTNVAYTHDENLSKKFDLLHVEAELKVSVLCGLLNVSGSGKYLTETKNSSRSVTSSLLVGVKTVEQSFQINNTNLKPYLITRLCGDATHYVGKIIWGGNSIVSVSYSNSENKSKQEISGMLSGKLEKLAFAIEGRGRVAVQNDEEKERNSFSFKFQSDSNVKTVPQSVEQAIEIMRSIPDDLRTANGGKGKQIEFLLYPIENLKQVLVIESQVDMMKQSLDLDCLDQISGYFCELEAISGRINDINQDFEGRFAVFLPDSVMREFRSVKNSLIGAFNRAKRDITEAIVAFRNGEGGIEEVRSVLEEKLSGTNSPDKCNLKLNQFDQISTKVKDLTFLISNYDFTFVGKGDSWHTHCVGSEVFLLVFSWTSAVMDPQAWLEAKSLFVQLKKEHTDRRSQSETTRFLIVDYDITPFDGSGIPNKKPILICHYFENRWKSCDVVADRAKEHSRAFVKRSPSCSASFISTPPNDRIKSVLPCPLIECGNDCHRWQCLFCKEEIDYVESESCFYCKCGLVPTNGLLFRCPCLSHGLQFDQYDENKLKPLLNKLKDNILYIVIMGETGSGKSTFINSFANYLQFSTLQDGLKNDEELITLIFNRYTLPDKTGKNVTFEVGVKSSDETPQDGQSSTQKCRTYSFYVGNKIIKLIDTPGINDSRGLVQDKQNLENILAYLGHFKKIHAFLYLIPAGLPRLTEQFKYCFKQLVAKLHVSAANNIVFVYTKCRSCIYTGGSSQGLMELLVDEVAKISGVNIFLNEHTQYFVDNESFGLLAGVKKGFISVESDKLKLFEDSWIFSSEQCGKLFRHIVEMAPHSINDTLSLHKIRQVFTKLAHPIALITQTIEKNIQQYKIQEERLQSEKLTLKELNDQLWGNQTVVETIQLSQPRTVCTDPGCCKKIKGDLDFTVYTQFCHDPCQLPPNPNLIPNPNIKQCHCFGGGSHDNCSACGHAWQNHMHVMVEYRPKTIKVKSPTIENQIVDAKNKEEVTKKLLMENRKHQDSLKAEQNELRKVTAKLAVFLKTNTIIPYDDTVGNLIEKEIELFREIPDKSVDQKLLLKKLEDMFYQYKEEIRNFQELAQQGDSESCSTVQEAERLIASLYDLKFIGPQLRQSMAVQSQATPIYEETSVPPKPRKASIWQYFGW